MSFQGRQALLGTILLVKADDGIDHDDGQDNDRILDVADERGEQRRTYQDKDQDALELAEKDPPRRTRRRFRQTVGAVLFPALLYLRACKTNVGLHLKARSHLFSG